MHEHCSAIDLEKAPQLLSLRAPLQRDRMLELYLRRGQFPVERTERIFDAK
jgi:hypothetical protein